MIQVISALYQEIFRRFKKATIEVAFLLPDFHVKDAGKFTFNDENPVT